MIGTTLSHYKIEARIGEGGMGVVYRATDTRLGRAVAIKVIASDAGGGRDRRDRFLREARSASALNHPNIVTIHEVDHANGSTSWSWSSWVVVGTAGPGPPATCQLARRDRGQ